MNQSNSHIVHCPDCGTANRIPVDKTGVIAKCGKCHTALPLEGKSSGSQESFKIRCTECGAKNKVPGDKLEAGPKCGKCGAKLKTEELFAAQPIMVTDGNFEDKIIKSPLPFLMWAWAPW